MSRTYRNKVIDRLYFRSPKTQNQLRQIVGIIKDGEYAVRNRDRGFRGSRYVSDWDDLPIRARYETDYRTEEIN